MYALAILGTSVDAGVVDHNIQTAVDAHGFFDQMLCAVHLGNIHGNRRSFAAVRLHFFDRFVQRFEGTACDDDLRSIFSKPDAHCVADGAAAAGNDRNLSVQIDFHLACSSQTNIMFAYSATFLDCL